MERRGFNKNKEVFYPKPTCSVNFDDHMYRQSVSIISILCEKYRIASGLVTMN